MTTRRPGRPPRFDTPASPAHLLHLLETADCSLAEACRRARTTPYLLRRMMEASPDVEFEVRVACLRPPRKRLGEGWGRPEVVAAAAVEADRRGRGLPARSWEEAQADAAEVQGWEAAAREPVTIPEAGTEVEEAF